jgi:hypothetical protein
MCSVALILAMAVVLVDGNQKMEKTGKKVYHPTTRPNRNHGPQTRRKGFESGHYPNRVPEQKNRNQVPVPLKSE